MVGKGVKALIATIVVVVVCIGSRLQGVYSTMVEHTNEMIKNGCSLKHGGIYGIPTLWKCPVPAGGGE